MLTVEMSRTVQHNKTKKAKIVLLCVKAIFLHHVKYHNRATTRVRTSRVAWTEVEQRRCVAVVRGSAVTGHTLSWKGAILDFASVRIRSKLITNNTWADRRRHGARRGRGAVRGHVTISQSCQCGEQIINGKLPDEWTKDARWNARRLDTCAARFGCLASSVWTVASFCHPALWLGFEFKPANFPRGSFTSSRRPNIHDKPKILMEDMMIYFCFF